MFDYDKYMPHGMCLMWEPWLVMLWVCSDLMIVTACMAIPLAILLVMRRRADLPHRGMITLFAAFILLCGVTHFLGIVTLWYPIYPFTGTVKLATGIISLAIAATLFRLIPLLVRIPAPDAHDEVIAQLEIALADLSRTRDELENRVGQRNCELRHTNSQLAFTARNAVHRSRNLLQTVSALTQPANASHECSAGFLRGLRGRINALVIATSAVLEQAGGTGVSLDRLIRRQIEPLFDTPSTQLSTDGPVVALGAQGAQQVSLVVWELCARFAQMERTGQSCGQIAITWSMDTEDGGEAQLSLEWRESFASRVDNLAIPAFGGDGTQTPAPVDEFSETLLTHIVPHLLGGKGRIQVQEATFLYRLTCPMSALDDTGGADIATDQEAEGPMPLLREA